MDVQFGPKLITCDNLTSRRCRVRVRDGEAYKRDAVTFVCFTIPNPVF